MKSFLILLVLLVAPRAYSETWNSSNDPSEMDANYEYRFTSLPTQAELEVKPWSETYWATAYGSINIRWNQARPQGFGYELYSKEEVLKMSKEELATLSPSEKFDLFLGDYQYSLHAEVSGFASPRVAKWKGLCDGWSMAAVQFAEPKPIEVKNPDGVIIPFGSSDVKGLLSYYAQFRSTAKQVYVGGQCRGLGGIFGSSGCSDINPGAMHVIMANQLGLKKQAFMMDRDPKHEIWNQPVYAFKTTVLGSAKSDAAQGIRVHTTLYYTDELDDSSWQPVVGTAQFKSDKIEMDYILDLDEAGKIVGGSYINRSEHPDLFWNIKSPITFDDEFKKLAELITQ